MSFLDAKGPTQRDRARVCAAPASQLGPITPQQRQALIAQSLVAGIYENGGPGIGLRKAQAALRMQQHSPGPPPVRARPQLETMPTTAADCWVA